MLENRPTLSSAALQSVLEGASPILGTYRECAASTCNWMKGLPDALLLTQLSIPGSHDSATGDYSQATQNALTYLTESSLYGDQHYPRPTPAPVYRCQSMNLLDQLDIGLRAFDLRVAWDLTNTEIVFYHGPALLSQQATLQDVLFGIYFWLDQHPTEVIFLSIMYESNTKQHAAFDKRQQKHLFDILTNAAARQYFVHDKNVFGTVGKARGKIVLLQRFTFDPSLSHLQEAIHGIHFPASKWPVNGPNVSLSYSDHLPPARIEDYYRITLPSSSSRADSIQAKYEATIAHLDRARRDQEAQTFYWTFASACYNTDQLPEDHRLTPHEFAMGCDGVTGMNQRLIEYLRSEESQTSRGIILMDFPNEVDKLIEAIVRLNVNAS